MGAVSFRVVERSKAFFDFAISHKKSLIVISIAAIVTTAFYHYRKDFFKLAKCLLERVKLQVKKFQKVEDASKTCLPQNEVSGSIVGLPCDEDDKVSKDCQTDIPTEDKTETKTQEEKPALSGQSMHVPSWAMPSPRMSLTMESHT